MMWANVSFLLPVAFTQFHYYRYNLPYCFKTEKLSTREGFAVSTPPISDLRHCISLVFFFLNFFEHSCDYCSVLKGNMEFDFSRASS